MFFCMFRCAEDLQVFESIVVSLPVFVMYNLASHERPSDGTRHDQHMLKDVAALVCVGVLRCSYKDVPVVFFRSRNSTLPVATAFSGIQDSVMLVFAVLGTVVMFCLTNPCRMGLVSSVAAVASDCDHGDMIAHTREHPHCDHPVWKSCVK